VRLSLNRPVIKIKTHNCCAEDLPQVRQVQVPEGVQGLPPGGRVRGGVGHGELTRAVQGRGEGEDEGGVAQGGGAGAQGPPPARVGNAEH